MSCTPAPTGNRSRQPAGRVPVETDIPWTLVKGGAKKRILKPPESPEAFRVEAVERAPEAGVETPALEALSLAHYWQHLLDTGKIGTFREIAAAESMDLGQVSRIARLAWGRGSWVVEKAR
jgi:hypothetical protein